MRQNLPLVLLLLLVAALGVGTAASSAAYEISIPGSVDTPERTVTREGTEFQITTVGNVQQGTAIQVSADAPTATPYSLYLYDNQRQIIDTAYMNGSGTHAFPTDDLDAGSYLVTIYQDGVFKDIQPVVVAGYTMETSVDSSVAAGEALDASVTLDSVTDTTLSSVELVLYSDDVTRRETATKNGDVFEATFDTSGLDAGTYTVYAAVRGTEQVEDERELLAVDEGQTVTITESTTSSSDGSDSSERSAADDDSNGSQSASGSSTGGSKTGETESVTTTDVETTSLSVETDGPTSDTATKTANSTATAEKREAVAPSKETDHVQQTPNATTAQQPTVDESVITPNQEQTTTTAATGPGMTIVMGLGAVIFASLIAYRRR
jgi:hypothetical protein